MFVRFAYKKQISYGILSDGKITIIDGDLFSDDYFITDKVVEENAVELLAPCEPSKVVCVGLNYKDHAQEMDLQVPDSPLLFLKPSTSIIGPNEEVHHPGNSERVEYEAELAVVIGEEAKDISEEKSHEYILGYTCANDVTARDIQFGDGQWTRGKSFDTFCPIGPGIVETVAFEDTAIELFVDGERKQHSTLNQLIFKVPYLVSYISRHMTLKPGDIILTGTPHGVGKVSRGETMTVAIEGIGELSNKIV